MISSIFYNLKMSVSASHLPKVPVIDILLLYLYMAPLLLSGIQFNQSRIKDIWVFLFIPFLCVKSVNLRILRMEEAWKRLLLCEGDCPFLLTPDSAFRIVRELVSLVKYQ